MKAVKYLWILSLLFYLASALFVYADVKEILHLHFDASGQPDLSLKKQYAFYYSLAATLLVNSIVLLLAHAMPYIKMPFRSGWMEDRTLKKRFFSNIKEWIRGFALIANLFSFVVNGAVYNLNSSSEFPADIFTYIVGAIALGWLIAYVPIFRKPDEV